jgi:adenylate cyclase
LGEFRFVGKADPLSILEVLALEKTASESQRKLCETFANAMEELRLGRWREAGEVFEAILRDYPEDGPSLFHLARCRRHVGMPSVESPWIVHMDAK